MMFRNAVTADAKQYIALRKAVLSESYFLLREPGEYSPSILEAEAEIARALTNENSRILVAERDGALVGFLIASGSKLRRAIAIGGRFENDHLMGFLCNSG